MQGPVLQHLASRLSPTQHVPPFDGGGLVQVLLRVIMPPPHVALHSLQSPKSLQPPSTAQEQMIATQIESKCSFPEKKERQCYFNYVQFNLLESRFGAICRGKHFSGYAFAICFDWRTKTEKIIKLPLQ